MGASHKIVGHDGTGVAPEEELGAAVWSQVVVIARVLGHLR